MSQDKMHELSIDDRRDKIVDILTRQNKVRVAELSRMFKISEATIRHDLSDLEKQGLLERVHGGATSTYKAYYNMSFYERMKTNEDEKRSIAFKAAKMISEGDSIMINSGTTTLYVARELKSIKNLTVVTNSLAISQELGNYKDIHVILLGGYFNPQYQFTYGDDTINQLNKYKADKLILAVDGICSENGITTYHYLEAEINRQMIKRVDNTVVAADYTKVGRTGFTQIDSIDSADFLITNSEADEHEIKKIIKKGLEVELI